MILPRIHVQVMVSLFAQLEREGVRYGYGVKAPSLDCPTEAIKEIDCSGYMRWALYRGSAGRLTLPDGSQAQREYMEQSGAHQLARYEDVIYANPGRFFICFIRPGFHGCGKVGHVWGVTKFASHPIPWTLESHGGGGCTSRPWNYPTLAHEAYSAFEIPTFGNEMYAS